MYRFTRILFLILAFFPIGVVAVCAMTSTEMETMRTAGLTADAHWVWQLLASPAVSNVILWIIGTLAAYAATRWSGAKRAIQFVEAGVRFAYEESVKLTSGAIHSEANLRFIPGIDAKSPIKTSSHYHINPGARVRVSIDGRAVFLGAIMRRRVDSMTDTAAVQAIGKLQVMYAEDEAQSADRAFEPVLFADLESSDGVISLTGTVRGICGKCGEPVVVSGEATE